MNEKNLLYCKYCGNGVRETELTELKEHLGTHVPEAGNFNEEQVKKEFTTF